MCCASSFFLLLLCVCGGRTGKLKRMTAEKNMQSRSGVKAEQQQLGQTLDKQYGANAGKTSGAKTETIIPYMGPGPGPGPMQGIIVLVFAPIVFPALAPYCFFSGCPNCFVSFGPTSMFNVFFCRHSFQLPCTIVCVVKRVFVVKQNSGCGRTAHHTQLIVSQSVCVGWETKAPAA